MSPTATSDLLPAGFSLTGGIPTKSQDLAASILFIIAYFLLVPLLVLRVGRKSSRTLVLIRPAIFVTIRIATYVIRAIQATGNEGEGLFVAEQIFLLCGFFLLLEPFSTLVKFNLFRDWIPAGKKDNLSLLLRLIRLAVFAAIALGIYVGSQINNAMTDASLARQLKRCRWASSILALLIIGVSLALALYAQAMGASDLRRTGYLGALAAWLLIPAVYKIVSMVDSAHPLSQAGKAVFYILFALPEYLAALTLLSINLETTFDIKEGTAKEKWNHKAQNEKTTGHYISPYEESSVEHFEMSGKP
ncbi:hypothetical protein JCM16303_000505 [Sporobolomyces ruberrimus]